MSKKTRASLGEVPEELLKGKSQKEQAGITRGYLAKTRMEEKELPGVTSLAQQRYVAPEKPVVPNKSKTMPKRPLLAKGSLSKDDPSKPPVAVHVPKSLRHLMAKDDARDRGRKSLMYASVAPGAAFAPPGEVPASTTAAAVGPDTCERVGLHYAPLSNIRTTYQNEEMDKRPHQGVRDREELPAGATAVQSAFFDLEDFDSKTDDPCPPQQLAKLGGAAGTPARSRCHNSMSEVVWAPCRVIEYDKDKEKFEIVWPDGKSKWTKRLNIIFDFEDEEKWRERVRRADRYREEFEAAIRESRYIESIPDAAVTPMNQDQMDRIIELMAKEFSVSSLHVVQQCTEQAERFYYMAAKKAVHAYHMRSAEEQRRLAPCHLPAFPPEPIPSLRNLKGTIFTPSPNYSEARSFIADNLFQVQGLLQSTLHAIHTIWFDYAPRALCVASFLDTPLQLQYFVDAQSQHGSATSEKLRGEWTSTVHSTIQNNLDAHFNFYENNMERYTRSNMCRFVSLVNTMMSSQLRSLIVKSMEAYTKFIATYGVASDDEDAEMEQLPEDVRERAHWDAREEELAQKQRELQERAAADRAKAPKPSKSAAAAAERSPEEEEENIAPFVWRLGVYTNEVPYTQRVVNLTQRINGLRPLFALKLVDTSGCIVFSPALEDVAKEVQDAFQQCLRYSSQVHGMGDQLFPLLEMNPFFLVPIPEDEPFVLECRETIRQTLEDNAEAPIQLQQMYKEFEYILENSSEEIAEEAVLENLSLDEFDLVFERLTRDIDRISERTPNYVKYELYAVDCQEIKNTLIRKANHLMAALMEVVASRLREDNAVVINSYEAIYQRLSIEPTTPEELQQQRSYLDSVPEKEAAIQTNFATVTEGNSLLLKYRFLVSEEDFVQYWVAYEWPRKLQQFMEDRNFRFKETRNVFMQKLREQNDVLSYDIMQLAASVEDFAHLGDDARTEEFNERAKEIAALIKKYQDQVVLYNSHEELFNLAPSQYPQLKELRVRFEPYSTLWEIASAFNAESERWLNTRLASLVPVEVDQKITDWSKKLTQISRVIKETEPSEVLHHLRENMDRFKPNIPLLYSLRSNLQASHWRAIYQQCGVPRDKQGFGPGGVDNNDQRPFSDFVKLGMLNYAQQVEAIATVAQKTYELESELMTMEGEWKKLLFEMEPYQDTYKLKANDAMQLTLDEHILKTQSMLGKPIVRQAPALQARVSQWEKQLNNMQSTMDEWFKCQNTWAYLEPIFSSADISRSLPKEKQLFVEIDDNWHTIMEHTRTTPQVLTRCQDETLMKTLSDANMTLDVILKKLQQFLETKRMAFPRFYFISNEELLQILSDSKDPFLVQPYLCKCFEGIKRIQFADHHDIIGMESAEGEVVPFIKKVNPGDQNNQVELWLQVVETVMKESIRDQLHQAIGDYAGSKRTDFIRKWPGRSCSPSARSSGRWTRRS
ncbi:dynein heavy chain [Strigomonas culicis]|uniref:Dynein heavy chain n=1 Tax=Strigomonas culicis TaxID=28005 RepID=S9VUJ5_9TRYP|nr:dynein heavy chain [Strigomonas culicis]|eukprot:EPY30841.1 dynein heavy chain [Strigomonas culicis]